MGSSGHAFIAHTKALSPPAQTKDGGYGEPPHPLAVRVGQKFWPLSGSRKRPFVVRSVSAKAGTAVGQRLDGNGEPVRVRVSRLLATAGDGRGAFYRFCGFQSRRFRTWATVAAFERSHAVLVLPEWHPARPVTLPSRWLPNGARAIGSWVECTADLSQPRGSQLGLADLRAAADPGAAACHRPAWTPSPAPFARPADTRDIVLDLPGDDLDGFSVRGGLLDVYVHERPAGLAPGGRVYLARSGADAIVDWLDVRGLEPRPMGTVIRCDPAPRPLDDPVSIDGTRVARRWRRRWWA